MSQIIYTPGKLTLAKTFTWNETVWNPSMISTALWLDAADSSTVTTVSGAVSQWNDKSGNGRNAIQGTAGNRPVYSSAGLNNLSTIDFDGSDDVLTATLNTGISDSYAVFAVVVPLRNQAIEGYVVSEVASYSNYWFNLGRGGPSPGQKMNMSLFDGSNNPVSEYTILPALGVGYIMSGIRDATTGARKVFYYQDGTLRGNVTDTTSLTAPAYSNLLIGAQVNAANRYGNVRIGEVVIVPSLPSTDTRQRIEGYLAHKWGLTANLPSYHPYKLTGPQTTVSPVTAYVQGLGIVTDGLVLNLDAGTPLSYPGSGTTWTDLSGYNNNGTLVNGVGFDGNYGGSLVFDGVNDYAPIGTSGFPFGNSAGTLSCWARTNTTAAGFRWIVSYGNGSASQSRFLGISGTTYYFGGFGNDIIASGVPVNTWINMVGVYNGTHASMYVNGVLVSGPTAKAWNTVANNAQVGRQTIGSEYWNGNIAQVSIYNKALTASEVSQNYNALKGRYGL